jgi:hypothetical protein
MCSFCSCSCFMIFWSIRVVGNDNILSELHTDWVSEVTDDEMNEAETLDTDVATANSCKWLWLYLSFSCKWQWVVQYRWRWKFFHHKLMSIVIMNCRMYAIQLVWKWVMKWWAISQNHSIHYSYRVTEVVSAVIDELRQLVWSVPHSECTPVKNITKNTEVSSINTSEMKIFWGLIILMREVRKDSMKDCWSTDSMNYNPNFFFPNHESKLLRPSGKLGTLVPTASIHRTKTDFKMQHAYQLRM